MFEQQYLVIKMRFLNIPSFLLHTNQMKHLFLVPQVFSLCLCIALFSMAISSPLRIARTSDPISDIASSSNSIVAGKDSTKQDLATAETLWGPPPPWAWGPGPFGPFGPGPFGPFGPGPFGPAPFGPGFGEFFNSFLFYFIFLKNQMMICKTETFKI